MPNNNFMFTVAGQRYQANISQIAQSLKSIAESLVTIRKVVELNSDSEAMDTNESLIKSPVE